MTDLTRHDRGTSLDLNTSPHAASFSTTATPQHNASALQFPPNVSPAAPPVPSTIPSFSNLPAFQYNASLHTFEPSLIQHPPLNTHRPSPLSPELRLDEWPDSHTHGAEPRRSLETEPRRSLENDFPRRPFHPASSLPVRTSSVRSLSASHHTGGSLSPASAFSSPGLGPLVDITPLPSPISQPSDPWPTMASSNMSMSRPGSSQSHLTPSLLCLNSSSPPKKRKHPGMIPMFEQSVTVPKEVSHTRNRSLSEYVPAGTAHRARNIAPSGTQTPTSTEPSAQPMQREEYLAVQRGISALPTPRPPTPPRSNRGATDSSESGSPPHSPLASGSLVKRYEARSLKTGKMRRWTAVRGLGTGTFSTVMLATSDHFGGGKTGDQLDPRSLVAVKICEHGPAGGADEKKIESSLKRELDILKSISHPSLVRLKAVNVLEKRAFLVLDYSPGGDLFDLASSKLDIITPGLIRRMFAELVGAVRYLHGLHVVHRDIKLENVLVNVHPQVLPTVTDWQSYPTPVVTLTDLGLGRYIPKPPESPLLNTRCGSEDYAAPELLMGQEYDGRATDAWALGVLLYALMEGRLPFDPIPGARRQSPTSHRIARCEWSWVKLEGADGEWDDVKGAELTGAKDIVEGLLKRTRTRWDLEKVQSTEWVANAMSISGHQTIDEED